MWTREELKTRGREIMHLSYWRSVLAALVLLVASGQSTSIISRITNLVRKHTNWNFQVNDHSFSFPPDSGAAAEAFAELPAILFPVAGLLAILFLSFTAVRLILDVFVFLPLETGARRFFIVNHYTKGTASASEIVHPFSSNYLNVVITMLLRDIYVILWGLLFVIPGIVKSYSYRLVPYIIAENPSMDQREAFRLSREMMNGEKWNAFVLDLSFIGWMFLGALTLGILDIFYVCPYKDCTDAELYITLKEKMFPRDAA